MSALLIAASYVVETLAVLAIPCSLLCWAALKAGGR